MPEHHIKKRKLIIWLTLSVLAIVILWAATLPFAWPDAQDGEKFTWPEWEGANSPAFQSLQTDLDNLMSKVNPENSATQASQELREVVSNPNELSEEEIKQIEEDIFPKEKNAKDKEETN